MRLKSTDTVGYGSPTDIRDVPLVPIQSAGLHRSGSIQGLVPVVDLAKERNRKKANIYYHKNREKCLKKAKADREANPEKYRDQYADYYRRNRAEIRKRRKIAYKERTPQEIERDSIRRKERRGYYQEYRNNNKQARKKYDREYQIRAAGYTSLAAFLEVVNQQNGKCAICSKEFTKMMPACADHDHAASKPRGALCHKCNTALGLFSEDVCIFEKAIEYVNKYRNRE
jgi:hypothetical protein